MSDTCRPVPRPNPHAAGADAERIAEREIDRVPWETLQQFTGSAAEVGLALRSLLMTESAESAEAAHRAYWRLENHVVVQGNVYEAAEATTSVLMAALAHEELGLAKSGVLELLLQILNGTPGEGADRGVVERCRASAMEGYWLLVRELNREHRDLATEILERLVSQDRLEPFL